MSHKGIRQKHSRQARLSLCDSLNMYLMQNEGDVRIKRYFKVWKQVFNLWTAKTDFELLINVLFYPSIHRLQAVKKSIKTFQVKGSQQKIHLCAMH